MENSLNGLNGNAISLLLENTSSKIQTERIETKEVPKTNSKNQPIGVYMGVKYKNESVKLLNQIAKDLDIIPDNGIGKYKDYEYHTTIIFSRHPGGIPQRVKDIRTITGKRECELNVPVKIKEFGFFDTPDGRNFHVCVDSSFIHSEWERGQSLGAKYDYPEYVPHISIRNNVPDDFKVPKNIKEKYIGKTLYLKSEYIQDLMDLVPVNKGSSDENKN